MGRASETPFSNSLSPLLEHSTVRPITGDLSFYQTGRGGLGYQFSPEPTQIRTAWTFNTIGALENVPLFVAYTRESGGFGYVVWYYNAFKHTVTFYYVDQDDDIVDTDTSDIPYVFGFNNSTQTTISCGIVIEVGAGGFASFYVNGEKILTFNASALGMEQATAIFAVKMGETNAGFGGMYETHFDDWYIDSSSGESDTVPPTRRFGITRPTAAGAYTDWTPSTGSNYQNVDELIGDDDDYNYSSLASDRDYFANVVFDVPDDTTVNSVIPIVRAKAGTPNPQLKIRMVSYDGLVSDYGSEQDIRLGYKYFWERYILAPDGSSWSEADINSNEFGYQLRT